MEQKKRFKLNVVDIVILGIVVLAAGLFVWRNAPRQVEEPMEEPKLTKVKYTLTLDNIELPDDTFGDGKVQVGDSVIDAASGVELGIITNIEAKDSRTYVDTADGRKVLAPRPLYSHLIITVEGEGELPEEGGGLLVEHLLLMNNKSTEYSVRDTALWLRLVNFTITEIIETEAPPAKDE